MPDFDPCGTCVDLLRSCYRTKMTLFANRPDIQTEVIWFFCDDNAQDLGQPTLFGSGNWASERFTWPGPGEVLGAPRPWRNGSRNPAYLGAAPCGTPDQFLLGTTFPPGPFPRFTDGVPLCCVSLVCDEFWGFTDNFTGEIDLNLTGFTEPSDPLDPCYGWADLNALWTLQWDSALPTDNLCAFSFDGFTTRGYHVYILLDLSHFPTLVLQIELDLSVPDIAIFEGTWTFGGTVPVTFPQSVEFDLGFVDNCPGFPPDNMTLNVEPRLQQVNSPGQGITLSLDAAVSP